MGCFRTPGTRLLTPISWFRASCNVNTTEGTDGINQNNEQMRLKSRRTALLLSFVSVDDDAYDILGP